ncbi:alpha-N-acetylgalactosaminide alpha-2,6-sialyltransferase 5-like isoform X2 [Branchiostoma floridae]|uniref:Alpha-N-acetylgalactosaminide alpha-2,6-sialyltransferase 5-like isoform X2 n=1 Tax=Branchiostoma floridae TaxID=7739 RepID=A0A9J7LIQ3_BRAFL|nr:alpha-N-acetylgalactosaminide alpha-2,6-sialyltransferase 5-like isoform X2 [Branchiostoma floridae]
MFSEDGSGLMPARRLLLIGLVAGFALFVSFAVYVYQGELTTQLWKPALDAALEKVHLRRLSNQNSSSTSEDDSPHPMPFNVTDPLSGYVNVIKDREPLKMHCNVCAMVSSSGQVLNHEAGAEIDKAECVIRMNDAPVTGFEKHVGTRTTIRVASHTSFQFVNKKKADLLVKNKGLTLVAWGPDHSMKTDGKGRIFNGLSKLAKELGDDIDVYMLTPQRMAYADKVFEKETGKPRQSSGSFLSTGWFTMILATEMCDQIKVYGMISDEYCKKYPQDETRYHYYASAGNGHECDLYKRHENGRKNSHRFITEKTVFSRWAAFHNVSFHSPSWH